MAACPCALVLSAPATAIAGIAVAARHGILIRSSAFLEELADLNSLVVDKTGTLTYGRLRLQSVQALGAEHPQLLELAASLGSASSHPVSRALAGLVDNSRLLPLTDTRERQGLGVVAATEHGDAALGRPELFEQLGIVTPQVPAHDGPWPGYRWTVYFWPGCCWPTASSPKPRLRCLNCVSWAWGGSYC
ncbi:cation-translocating P-type ATPase [Pseudomonas syringae pv. actinidiae]|nr:cation-translocating P-type ATPase [Pseudomonas syringae pv. actinidiae]